MIDPRRHRRRQRQAEQLAEKSLIAEQARAWIETYLGLTEQLTAARRAVAGDPRQPADWTTRRESHRLLTSLLGDAVTFAIAADAAGAPCPRDLAGWMSEGLARSTERELAIFAALDVG